MAEIIIIGAGLAGATAAALLKNTYHVTVYERLGDISGHLYDRHRIQQYGPHAFHTDSLEVWKFIQQFAEFKPYHLRVFAFSEPSFLQELPIRPKDNTIFRVYSEKAWGKPFEELPQFIQERVPQVSIDTRIGYHTGTYKGQPTQGFYALLKNMLQDVDVYLNSPITRHSLSTFSSPIIWTGAIADYTPHEHFPWIGREWIQTQGSLAYPIINYTTHLVPQLRSYDCEKINPYYGTQGVISEFLGDAYPCYPVPDKQFQQKAKDIVHTAQSQNHWLCGRLGTYQYLDMDATIANVFATLREAHLIKPLC